MADTNRSKRSSAKLQTQKDGRSPRRRANTTKCEPLFAGIKRNTAEEALRSNTASSHAAEQPLSLVEREPGADEFDTALLELERSGALTQLLIERRGSSEDVCETTLLTMLQERIKKIDGLLLKVIEVDRNHQGAAHG